MLHACTHMHTHLYSSHYGAHEVGTDEVVPETVEPGLQFSAAAVEGAGHEDTRPQVHHVGVELVDEGVEVVEQVRHPVHQALCNRVQRPVGEGLVKKRPTTNCDFWLSASLQRHFYISKSREHSQLSILCFRNVI